MLISIAQRRAGELLLLVLSPISLVVMMVNDSPQPWRASAAAVFFLLAPGIGVLAPMHYRLDLELALAVPVSLAVTSLVSLPLFYLGLWSGGAAVAVLMVVCARGALMVWARPSVATAQLPTSAAMLGSDR
jgi:hypothetical protein